MITTKKIFFTMAISLIMVMLGFKCSSENNPEPTDSNVITTSGDTTAPEVEEIHPPSGISGLPLNTLIIVTFGEPINANSVTVNTTDTQCTGSIQISAKTDDFSQCVTLAAQPVTVDNVVFTIQLKNLLAASTNYKIKITTGITDIAGNPIAANYNSGFVTGDTEYTVSPTVINTYPSEGAGSVAINTGLTVTFDALMTSNTIELNTADTTCSGTIQVSSDNFITCLQMQSQAFTDNYKTFVLMPFENLAADTNYKFKITTGVKDAAGNALAANYNGATGFTTGATEDLSAPAEITGPASTIRLQSIELSYTNPTDADFYKNMIYFKESSEPAYSSVNIVETTDTFATIENLKPDTSYDFKIVTVDYSGNESAGTQQLNNKTIFSGHSNDWMTDQTVSGQSSRFYFTWNDSTFFTGVSSNSGANLLVTDQDALWIAIDTDPSSDSSGEYKTTTIGLNDIIWPFKADYIIEFLPGTTDVVNIWDVSSWTNITAEVGVLNFDGDIDEIAIPKTLISSPSSIRIAFAAIDKTLGETYAIAPSNSSATDTTGLFASLTSAYNINSNIWDNSKTKISAAPETSPLIEAATLVNITLNRTQAASGNLKIRGNLHPLSLVLSESQYTLKDDGTQSDTTAGDFIYSGKFNFGASTEELFFRFNDASTNEPIFNSVGTDRIYKLNGLTETMPPLIWDTPYTETPAVINWVVNNCPADIFVQGNTLPLSLTENEGAQLSLITGTCSGLTEFSNGGDFTGTLEFKGQYSGIWELDCSGGGVPFKTINDNVINERTISWNWNGTANADCRF
ncbi:MAG: Ig-like domain-containing protein [Spirochaetia bacterium]|nr:Ig-like domain-containing protein [Spirochaetia bacterium]